MTPHTPAGAVLGPFRIGGVVVDPPVVLAPMADVTNGAFRRLCKRLGGPGLLCTEQISTMALHYASQRTQRMIDWTEAERPLSVQLFGADPAIMAEAARVVEARGADIVDINMGCWVPKVCRQGAGAALLRDEETALRVVSAVLAAVRVPVTVKMRAGWDLSRLNSPELARRFADLGVAALALHARTARQGFEGEADWRWIARIREAVAVPVVGNGDVRTGGDAARMAAETGCAAVMIGRAAIGNPWALREAACALRGEPAPPPPSLQERIEAALQHVTALAEHVGEEHAVRHLRGQLPHYVKGVPGAVRARERIVRALTIADVEAVMRGLLPH